MTNAQAGFFIMIDGMMFIAVTIVITIYGQVRYRKYDEIVKGTVIDYKRVSREDVIYPVAIVEYYVNGKTYQVKQKYSTVNYNGIKHAKYDWELDDKYRLHCYNSLKCEYHVNPTVDWFPIGSKMDVHYNSTKPQKAYCGSLASVFLAQVIFLLMGLLFAGFGILLMTLLK